MARFTISVTGQKGGIAKTTTALGLAGAFAEQGKRVLLVDLDPQGNLTLGIGFQTNGNNANLTAADVLLKSLPAQNAIYPTKVQNIDLIPASLTLRLTERYFAGRPSQYGALRKALDSPKCQDYDYVIIDSPPSLGALTGNALTAADLALLPTQAEYFSAYALKTTLQMVETVRRSTNPNLAYRILITMFRRRNRAHAIIRARLEATFGNGLCKTVIETDTKLRESAIIGLPITHFAPKTRSAMQYRELAKELAAYVQEEKIRKAY